MDSKLHIGLLPGQHRPSQDRLRQRPVSPALRYLLAVAARAGLGAGHAATSVHAVLDSFAGCLPAAERRRLLGCLPADVGRLAGGGQHGWSWTDHPGELIARVAAVSGLDDLVRAERVTVAVLGALREILPALAVSAPQPAPNSFPQCRAKRHARTMTDGSRRRQRRRGRLNTGVAPHLQHRGRPR